jgi:hypothetical protein
MRDNPPVSSDMENARRRRITVRRFISAADAGRHDLEYWRSLPDAERILLAWHLSEELWALRGESTYEPGLRRPVTRLQRR